MKRARGVVRAACLLAVPAAWGVGLTVSAGCATETRVIPKNKPMLSGLAGVEGGGARRIFSQAEGESPLSSTDRGPTRETLPGGEVLLRSPTVRDLMRHILETIQNDEEALFTGQVLSTITRREFVERGHDPKHAFLELQRRRQDVRLLFRAMPAGEFTPGMLMQPVGRNIFRLRVEGDPEMRWKFMDVVFENGEYRLRWFGG